MAEGMNIKSVDPILHVDNVTCQFGGITAVNGATLQLGQGEIRALIGPNGAGKTTLFNLVTGVHRCKSGRIVYKNREIGRLLPYERFKLGIGRSFQIVNLFRDLTVEENVRVAVQSALKRKTHPFEVISRSDIDRSTQDLLSRHGWFKNPGAKAGTLIYAEQNKLETLLALTSNPDLLLLDEPTAGIDEQDINVMTEMIRSLASTRTILITDHDIRFVMSIADRISVLDQGSVIAEGTPDEVAANPRVDEVYLGGGKE